MYHTINTVGKIGKGPGCDIRSPARRGWPRFRRPSEAARPWQHGCGVRKSPYGDLQL